MEREANYQSLPSTLRDFYRSHNGFFAFDRALLVRPYKMRRGVLGLVEWNDPKSWKLNYECELEEYVFFADDIAGYSFCLGLDQKVYFFDPEQGELEHYADSIDAWVDLIVHDPNEIGASLAASWAEEHGEIPFGYRLPPVVPFVFAESEGLGNVLAPELPLMRYRALLARAISGIQDGGQVRIQSLVEYLREHS